MMLSALLYWRNKRSGAHRSLRTAIGSLAKHVLVDSPGLFRCDSTDTALHLHVSLQTMLNKAEHQRRINELERCSGAALVV